MSKPAQSGKEVLREVDTDALNLAQYLLRATPVGALGSIDPVDGSPFTSLTTVATDLDGAPLILISALSTHTQALQSDNRCSLLLAQSGRGDALAHPRMTITAAAQFLERDSAPALRARRRFLARHQKASLYCDFGDFSFVRLEPLRASLNGGFGKAYALDAADLLADSSLLAGFDDVEASAVAHMNDDHQAAIQHYATVLCQQPAGDWHMTGIDPYGIDLACNERVCRYPLQPPLSGAKEIRARLVALAKSGRSS